MASIDLGTTFTKQAYVDPTGKPVMVTNQRGDQSTPSVLLYSPDGDVLVGKDAAEQAYLTPELCVRHFKLLLGSPENLLANGRHVTAEDAAATLLGHVREDMERQLGCQVTECVATCPANFRDDQKQALLGACKKAGITVLKLVSEPVAAGIAYSLDKAADHTHLIVDCGGGTTDVAVQRVEGSQITTLATEGIPKLGGQDFNACLARRILEAVEQQCKVRPSPQDDPLFFYDTEQRAEAAKISLGKRPEVPIVIAYKGTQVIVKVTQKEFQQDVAPLIQQCLDAVDRAVAGAGLTLDKIDRLILVGGTSRMQCFQERLADHTRMVPKTDVDPEKAIAYGAALAYVAEKTRRGEPVYVHGRVIPDSGIVAKDVTAHAIGCCVVDKSGPQKRLIHSVIIRKNTPIPCQKTDRFFLEHEDQTEAHVEILQGEPEAERDDCLLIGELNLTNLPVEPRRTQRIQVEYSVDANGMVTATATDTVSGQQQTVSIDHKKLLKPKDRLPSAV